MTRSKIETEMKMEFIPIGFEMIIFLWRRCRLIFSTHISQNISRSFAQDRRLSPDAFNCSGGSSSIGVVTGIISSCNAEFVMKLFPKDKVAAIHHAAEHWDKHTWLRTVSIVVIIKICDLLQQKHNPHIERGPKDNREENCISSCWHCHSKKEGWHFWAAIAL